MKSIWLFFLLCSTFQLFAQVPKLTVQAGHEGRATYVSLSTDNQLIATTGTDNTIKIWEVKNGYLLRTLEGHQAAVNSLEFSANNRFLVSCSNDSTVKVWEVKTGKMFREFKGHGGPVNTATFSPDGLTVASGSGSFTSETDDHSIRLWDVLKGIQVSQFEGHDLATTALSFNSNGKYLVSGGESGNIKLWMLRNKTLLREYKGHEKRVNTLKFSPDGLVFASGGFDRSLRIWDIISGLEVHQFQGNSGNANSFVFSENGRYLVSGNQGKQVALFEVETGEMAKTYKTRLNWITSVSYNLLGEIVATGATTENTLIEQVETGTIRCELKGYSQKIEKLAFHPNGKMLAFLNNSKSIKLLDVATGMVNRQLTGHTAAIQEIAFEPHGKWLASGSADRTVRLWNVDKDGNSMALKAHRKGVFSLAFNGSGNLLASGSADGTVIMWDLLARFPVDTLFGNLKAYYEPAWQIALSPDSKLLYVAGQDQNMKAWTVETGAPLGRVKAHTGAVKAMVLLHNGKEVATGGLDGAIRIWSHMGSKFKMELKGHTAGVVAMAVSPNGQVLASAGRDREVILWDTKTGKMLSKFSGHSGTVNTLAFHPNGKYLFSGSNDAQLKLWDVAKKKELASLVMMENGKDFVVVTPGGLFDGTTEAISKALHYVQDNEVVPLEAYFENFYTPELWQRIMNGEDPDEMGPNIAEFINIPSDVEFFSADKHDPRIRYDVKKAGYVATSEKVRLALEAFDNGGGIDEVRVYQNGKLIFSTGQKFKKLIEEGAAEKIELEATLVDGSNQFRAIAYNQERTESMHELLTLHYEDPYKPEADLYIVNIGINEYLNPAYRLNAARNDAHDFTEAIIANSKGIFRNINRVDIYDTTATAQNIFSALDSVALSARPNDVFIFYYAGHGALAEANASRGSEYYLIPFNVTQVYGAEKELEAKALSASKLMVYSQKIKAQKQMIVLDACQSGGAISSFATRGAKEQKAMMQLARSAGVVLLAASGQEEFAAEISQLGHGVFTYALLEGLTGSADGGLKDRKITVNELKGYLEDRVPQLTQEFRGRAQYPTGYSRGQDFPIVIVE